MLFVKIVMLKCSKTSRAVWKKMCHWSKIVLKTMPAGFNNAYPRQAAEQADFCRAQTVKMKKCFSLNFVRNFWPIYTRGQLDNTFVDVQ